MTQTLDITRQVSGLLGELARIDRAVLNDAELVELVSVEETAGRFLDTSRALSAGEIAHRSRSELGGEGLSFAHGHRRPVHFVELLTRTSQSEAYRRIRIGLAIRHQYTMSGEKCPPLNEVLAKAMVEGSVGADSAIAIITCLHQARTGSDATFTNLQIAETELVQLAGVDSADLVWNAGRAWRDHLDPDGVEPRGEDILQKTGITSTRQIDGIKHYHLRADPLSSALIDSALADGTMFGAVPRFLSESDAARSTEFIENEDGELVETIVDNRSIERKRFDIFMGVFLAGVRTSADGPVQTRVIANVNATVRLQDLQTDPMFARGAVGHLEGSDEVLSLSAIREMVCDSGFTITILGNGLEPLALGVRERSHNKAQRRAIAARDGDRCIAPGCQVSASGSNVHHVVFWSLGGATDVDNGVFLCPAHHHALHMGAFEVTMIASLPYIRLRTDAHDPTAWKRAGRTRQRTLIGSK